jgi:hypothetical protein
MVYSYMDNHKERQAREAAERQALIERQGRRVDAGLTPQFQRHTVQRDGTALIGLECTGSTADQSCGGKLTLPVQAASKALP